MNSEVDEHVKRIVAKHARCTVDALVETTRLGEDLKIIGDDAEEFLSEFATTFDIDMSRMVFGDYFPEEATSDMHYYLASIAQQKRGPALLQMIRKWERKYWGMFAKRRTFKTITIKDLILATRKGKLE